MNNLIILHRGRNKSGYFHVVLLEGVRGVCWDGWRPVDNIQRLGLAKKLAAVRLSVTD